MVIGLRAWTHVASGDLKATVGDGFGDCGEGCGNGCRTGTGHWTLRMRLLEASSVPVTAKDWLGAIHLVLASGYGMRDPVTNPLEILECSSKHSNCCGAGAIEHSDLPVLKLEVVEADGLGRTSRRRGGWRVGTVRENEARCAWWEWYVGGRDGAKNNLSP